MLANMAAQESSLCTKMVSTSFSLNSELKDGEEICNPSDCALATDHHMQLRELKELMFNASHCKVDTNLSAEGTLAEINSILSRRPFSIDKCNDLLIMLLFAHDFMETLDEPKFVQSLVDNCIPTLWELELFMLSELEKLQKSEEVLLSSEQKDPCVDTTEITSHSDNGEGDQNVVSSLPQEGSCSNIYDKGSVANDADMESTELSNFVNPRESNLHQFLRSIRQHIIYFEAFQRSLDTQNTHETTYSSSLSQLLLLIILELAHRKNIIPDLPSLLRMDILNEAMSKLLIKIMLAWKDGIAKKKEGEANNVGLKDDIQLNTLTFSSDAVPADEAILTIVSSNRICQIRLPMIDWVNKDSHVDVNMFLDQCTLPSSIVAIWAIPFFAASPILDDPNLLKALEKLQTYEQSGKILRWADISRLKTRCFILPLLEKDKSLRHITTDVSLLRRVYFASGFVSGLWAALWSIVYLFIFVVVVLQLVSAESLVSIIPVWDKKDQYALTALLYESANSGDVLVAVSCISALPILWGLFKGIKATRNVSSDPVKELQVLLHDLQQETNSEQGYELVMRALWWDRLRWNLPWYRLRNCLEAIMEMVRWDGRLSALNRMSVLATLINLYRNRGGYTCFVTSSNIAEMADMVAVSENELRDNRVEEVPQSKLDQPLLSVISNLECDESVWGYHVKRRSTDFIIAIGKFPTHEWHHAHWYARPSVLVRYLEGKSHNWWLGLTESKIEFVFFLVIAILLAILSSAFLLTVISATKEYLDCPQKKGVTFAGLAPYVGKYDGECWDETMRVFGQIPGQPTETFLSMVPLFYFNQATKRSFTLDLSGKSLDGIQISQVIEGFQSQGFAISKLIAYENSFGDFILDNSKSLSTLAKALRGISSTLEVLDFSKCSLAVSNTFQIFAENEWVEFNNALASLANLKTLKMSGNLLGIGYPFYFPSSVNSFALSLGNLQNLEYLDLSANSLSQCFGHYIFAFSLLCSTFGDSIGSLQKLRVLDLSENEALDSYGHVELFSKLMNPELRTLKLSNTIPYSAEIKLELLKFMQRSPKLEDVNLEGTLLGFVFDDMDAKLLGQTIKTTLASLGGSLKRANLKDALFCGVPESKSEFFQEIVEGLSHLKAIEELDISDSLLSITKEYPDNIDRFINMVEQLTSVRKLYFSENLDLYAWRKLKPTLIRMPHLVDFTNYLEHEDEVEKLLKTTSSGKASFNSNIMCDGTQEANEIFGTIFRTIGQHVPKITSLNLTKIGLATCNDIEGIGLALDNLAMSGTMLQDIDISGNDFLCKDDASFEVFRSGILKHKPLKHLRVKLGDYLSVPLARMIGNLFKDLPQLESLEFTNVGFKDIIEEFKLISEGIKGLTNLRKLTLQELAIKIPNLEGLDLFFSAIAQLKSLRSISLSHIYPYNDGYFHFLLMFSKVFVLPLYELRLRDTLALQNDQVEFFKEMKKLSELRVLDLSKGGLGLNAQVEESVIDAIKSFKNLCELNVEDNSIGSLPGSTGLRDIMFHLPNLAGYNFRGAGGIDWTDNSATIYTTITRELRAKCESRVCRGTKVSSFTKVCQAPNSLY